MTDPVIAQRGPYRVELEQGTYWWCRCGLSAKQPFCDGSHKRTDLTPIKVEIAESGSYALCGCKHSAKRPFCDGTHRNLGEAAD